MFQFTTETIINSFDGHLKTTNSKGTTIPNLKLIAGTGATSSRIAYDKESLMIEKLGTFRWKNIKSISVTAGRDAVHEKIEGLTVDFTNIKKGDVIRLSIYARQEGRVISTFNNHYPIHVNPYQFEVTCDSNADASNNTLDHLCEVVQDVQRMSDINYFTVTNNSGLTIEATDEYTRFVKVELVKVNRDRDKIVGEILTGYNDYTELTTWDIKDPNANGVTFTRGNVGTGTVSYILHNLRLPTAENYNPYSAFKDEMPIPGTLYTQICMEYCVPDIHGASYTHVGAQNNSLTTHIIFMPNEVATDFIDKLTKAFVEEDNSSQPILLFTGVINYVKPIEEFVDSTKTTGVKTLTIEGKTVKSTVTKSDEKLLPTT